MQGGKLEFEVLVFRNVRVGATLLRYAENGHSNSNLPFNRGIK